MPLPSAARAACAKLATRDTYWEAGLRINYEIPDDLHHEAKAAAALEGKTLRQFVVEALREAVERRGSRRGRRA